MRDFINDHRLLAILDLVEEALDHEIIGVDIDKDIADLFACGVSLHEGRWLFFREGNQAYPNPTMFHELMHIILWIEGWPNYMVRGFYSHANPEYYKKCIGVEEMGVLATNILQHPVVWGRGDRYGYSEMDEWNKHVSDLVVLVGSRTIEWGSHFAEEYLIGGQALHLAHAILSPAAKNLRSDLERQARIHLPKALQVAEYICRVQEQLCKSFPGSFDAALKKVVEPQTCPKMPYYLIPLIDAKTPISLPRRFFLCLNRVTH